MKTVMQEHISHMKKIQEMVKLLNVGKDREEVVFESIEGCIRNAESSLKAEKEQIWMAFNDGKISAIVKNQRTPEEYYNLTYKSDE